MSYKRVIVREVDGSPIISVGQIVFPNGSITASGDQATVAFTGIDLATGVTGVLPTANGGVGNNTVAGQGYFYGGCVNSPSSGAAAVVTGTANVVRVHQFVLTSSWTIRKLALEVTTLSVSNNISFGLYNAVGTTLLLNSGLIDATTTGAKTVTLGAAVNLTPGVYWYAYTATDNVVQARSWTPVNTQVALNANVVRHGTAANAATAGALPASLGVITTGNFNVMVGIFEP